MMDKQEWTPKVGSVVWWVSNNVLCVGRVNKIVSEDFICINTSDAKKKNEIYPSSREAVAALILEREQALEEAKRL